MKKSVLRKSCLLSIACALSFGFTFEAVEAAPETSEKVSSASNAGAVSENKDNTKNVSEVKLETKSDAQTEAKSEVKSEIKPEAKSEAKSDVKPENKSENKSETKKDDKKTSDAKDIQPVNNAPAPSLSAVLSDPARPSDNQIMSAIQKYNGKTVAGLNFEGGSDESRPTAIAAVSMREGDTLNADTIGNDATAIMETGYFVDVYPTFEEVPEGVVVTYHLQEYPKFNGVKFTGNKMVKTQTLEEKITLRPGDRYNSVTFHKNMEEVEGIYKKDGYIQAKIVDMKRDKDGVIEVKINEGILEGYRVKGNTKTKERVILREMRQKPGEPFNANKARRSYQRVNNLGIFEEVHTRLLPGVEPNSVIMEVEVKEKRTGTFGIGAGYSSQDGPLGMVSLSDTNFRGTGDYIGIVYELSGNDTDARGYSFTYKKPWLDKRETAGTLRLYNRTYQYNDYDINGNLKEEYMRKYSGGEITISRPFSEYSTNYVTIRNRKDRYIKHLSTGNVPDRSGAYGEQWRKDNFGTTRSIIFQHVTDTRDNIYEPTSGGKVSLTGELAGFGGNFNFKKVSIEDARFRKVGRAQVLAARVAYGVGQGDISEFNQFKIGGQDTLRGYRDDQFRGNRMCLATLEYRFPLISKVQGALFTDWGAAWNDGFRPKNFNGSVGIGLSFNTPLGPLRLDYGRGKNGGRVHFTIGGMF